MSAPVPSGEGPAERAAVSDAERDAVARHLMFGKAFGMSEQERAAQWKAAQRRPSVMRYWRAEAAGILRAAAAARPDPSPAEAALRSELAQAIVDRDANARSCRMVLADMRRGGLVRSYYPAVSAGEDLAAAHGDIDALREKVERLTRERDERETWADDWHRVVEVILTMADLSPALGASEAAPAMQAWMVGRDRMLAAAESRAEAAERALGEARGMLRRVEWARYRTGLSRACPCCGEYRTEGHAPDCALAAQLAPRPGAGEARTNENQGQGNQGQPSAAFARSGAADAGGGAHLAVAPAGDGRQGEGDRG